MQWEQTQWTVPLLSWGWLNGWSYPKERILFSQILWSQFLLYRWGYLIHCIYNPPKKPKKTTWDTGHYRTYEASLISLPTHRDQWKGKTCDQTIQQMGRLLILYCPFSFHLWQHPFISQLICYTKTCHNYWGFLYKASYN